MARSCPFCKGVFRGLGNHLPRCKERKGQDYSAYLSLKTLAKKSGKSFHQPCPHCRKLFRRVDTHLQRNALCKRIAALSLPDQPPLCRVAEPPTNENHHHITHPASGDIHPRMILCLPRTQEEWDEANTFFSEQVVISVCQADSVAEKNRALTEGVYDYFATRFGTKPFKRSKQRALRKTRAERRLVSITERKNAVRSQLRKAKQEGATPAIIADLAKSFFQLVREHSKAGHAEKKCKNECRQRSARSKCHQNIHKFAKSLFDTSDDSDISPQFGKSDAECFFREVYSSGPRNFVHPEWLPTPAPPQYEFNCEAISIQEVTEAIRHTRSTSTPSPLDQISYTIFKKCPSLHNALVDIYNLCWEKSDVPPAWKTAVIKLLPKSAAT